MSLPTRLVAGGLAVALASLAIVSTATADSVADKQREAQQIADQIEQLGVRAGDLGEVWNNTKVELQQAQADVKEAETKLASLEARLGSLQSNASQFAVRAYIYADQTGGMASLLAGSSLTDGSAQRSGYESVALGNTMQVTDDMRALIEDTDAERAVLDTRRQLLDQKVKDVAAAKQAAEAAQQQALVRVKGELAVLVREEQQRRLEEQHRRDMIAAQQARAALAAAQARAAMAAAATAAAAQPDIATTPAAVPADNGGGGQPTQQLVQQSQNQPTPQAAPQYNIPPTSPGAAIAVRAALSQLGVPYRFAAATPGVAFDCSGLTMWAWAQAGVSMPHGSIAQYYMFPHIPFSAIQPGDLVFFNNSSTPLGHVGIYIGNGSFVQAPHTGDVVKISTLNGRSLAGIARP
jgi:cell wall-associated NlpC family hydrolase